MKHLSKIKAIEKYVNKVFSEQEKTFINLLFKTVETETELKISREYIKSENEKLNQKNK